MNWNLENLVLNNETFENKLYWFCLKAIVFSTFLRSRKAGPAHSFGAYDLIDTGIFYQIANLFKRNQFAG